MVGQEKNGRGNVQYQSNEDANQDNIFMNMKADGWVERYVVKLRKDRVLGALYQIIW